MPSDCLEAYSLEKKLEKFPLYFFLTFEHVTLKSNHFMMFRDSHFIKVQERCIGQVGDLHSNRAGLALCESIGCQMKSVELER